MTLVEELLTRKERFELERSIPILHDSAVRTNPVQNAPVSSPEPLGWKLRFLHAVVFTLAFTGIRDRLRCPKCKAVGTWKPHGGIFALGDKRKVIRWLCKFCGHYRGPEGERQAFPSTSGAWEIDETIPEGYVYLRTPQETLTNGYGKPVWPWRG